MHLLIAMDSFKGSLTSLEAGNAVKEAFLSVNPRGTALVSPMADGGEGTVTALTLGLGGELKTATVTGPLGEPVNARYGILPGAVAVLEMAEAAGLPLVGPEKRDPMHTTTYGVGELIRIAMDQGCRQFIIGIGGSATNDGGTGMLTALGYAFLDKSGAPIKPGAKGLEDLHHICLDKADPRLSACTFRVACDVTNPLCGPLGCSAVFAPQKGAGEADIPKMDAWLSQYARLTAEHLPAADPQRPGAGAAGGMGFALMSYLKAEPLPGVELVQSQTGLEEKIKNAHLVITGEGKLDGQTAMGKAPAGVARLAKKYAKPVIAFAGCLGGDVAACKAYGIDEYYAITPADMPLAKAMDPATAYENLKNTATRVLAEKVRKYYADH